MEHTDGDLHQTQNKTITCKAAVLWGPRQSFVIEKIQVDPPREMEVRVKILFTSICHTDLNFWNGQNEAQNIFPRILGHEASGIVESVGAGVTDIGAGDHVIPIFNGECGNCVYCKSEKTNKCTTHEVDPMRKTMVGDGACRFSTVAGEPIYHFLNTSTFSEYTVVSAACLVKICPEAPLKTMTLLSCGVSTGSFVFSRVGAAWNTADVKAGSTVAIFGLGSVGLAVAEGARARGASKIIGVDINPNKFAKGKILGVTDLINPKDLDIPVNERINELVDGGVDYSFECTGIVDVLRESFLSVHKGWGLTVLLGIQSGPRTLPLHPMELFAGRTLVGCIMGGFKGKTQLPQFSQQCLRGEVNLDEFITHELPFEKINEAFQLLIDGDSLRCVLHL